MAVVLLCSLGHCTAESAIQEKETKLFQPAEEASARVIFTPMPPVV